MLTFALHTVVRQVVVKGQEAQARRQEAQKAQEENRQKK